jgi:hypothetical protein
MRAFDVVGGSISTCGALHRRDREHRLGGNVMFKLTKIDSLPVRPRVTPDPERAAELQRRIEALQYRPETGFHRDRLQGKTGRPLLRLVK